MKDEVAWMEEAARNGERKEMDAMAEVIVEVCGSVGRRIFGQQEGKSITIRMVPSCTSTENTGVLSCPVFTYHGREG